MNLRQFFTTNQWWGKLIGCCLGYLMTRSPIGALVGILIGNAFDRGLANHFSQLHGSYYDEKRELVQKIFFEATFSVMGHVAKADGRVTENEIQMARQMMNELRLTREQKQLAKAYFSAGKAADFDLSGLLNLLQNACRNNPDLLKLFMDIQYRYAQVDGLSANKVRLLDTIFRTMGFAPLHQQYRYHEDFHNTYERKQESQGQTNAQNTSYGLAQAYALLEVNPAASKQEVKRAWRKMISKNHPDKLIAQGLPEKMIKLANDKTQKITKAYEDICAAKGW
ncbi:co-chaperone DjlA [Legionella sp. CNM-4043-24]|uniref:co-chaperone DjlA n=1 Tax=Legionella sp. CNM-4043-24 TaxID=3421646 RepID=UPI00403AC0AC